MKMTIELINELEAKAIDAQTALFVAMNKYAEQLCPLVVGEIVSVQTQHGKRKFMVETITSWQHFNKLSWKVSGRRIVKDDKLGTQILTITQVDYDRSFSLSSA